MHVEITSFTILRILRSLFRIPDCNVNLVVMICFDRKCFCMALVVRYYDRKYLASWPMSWVILFIGKFLTVSRNTAGRQNNKTRQQVKLAIVTNNLMLVTDTSAWSWRHRDVIRKHWYKIRFISSKYRYDIYIHTHTHAHTNVAWSMQHFCTYWF